MIGGWGAMATPAMRLRSLVMIGTILLEWMVCVNALSDEGWMLLKFKANLYNSADVLHNWNASNDNPCQWTGVKCDTNNTRVTYLNLPYRQLRGTISPVVGQLSHLKRLGLHENDFIGPIPRELQHLTRLRALYLRGNTLTGRIPPALGVLSKLEILDISRNELTGTIPETLGNLTKLRFLNVSANFLVGAIPTTGTLHDFSSASFQGNLDLCGPQVNERCNNASPDPAAAPKPEVIAPSPCAGVLQPGGGSEDNPDPD